VARSTLYRWFAEVPAFKAEVDRAIDEARETYAKLVHSWLLANPRPRRYRRRHHEAPTAMPVPFDLMTIARELIEHPLPEIDSAEEEARMQKLLDDLAHDPLGMVEEPISAATDASLPLSPRRAQKRKLQK